MLVFRKILPKYVFCVSIKSTAKIDTYEVSLNLFVRFYWNCAWLHALTLTKWLFVWIFKGWNIFGFKIQKCKIFRKICSLDFSEILSDDRHSKGSKSYCFFIRQYVFDYTILGTFLVTKLTFYISFFVALFFMKVMLLGPGSIATLYLFMKVTVQAKMQMHVITLQENFGVVNDNGYWTSLIHIPMPLTLPFPIPNEKKILT